MSSTLFRDCLRAVPSGQRAAFDLSFAIAARLDAVLKERGMTRHDLAVLLGKRDPEVSRWLTGRHNFTTRTIAAIEQAVGAPIVSVCADRP